MAKHYLHSTALQQPQYQPSSAFLTDALYCSEETWEEQIRDDYFQQVAESEEEEAESFFINSNNNKKRECGAVFLEQDLYWEEEELLSLLAKQEQNQIKPTLIEARRQAVEWMFKVNAHYSFTALTAVLAVNYLDRFLSNFHLQTEKPWTTQLAAVACLSLAAKVEETEVPLLLDLQVEDSKYVFEAKTIQRMEILILSTLQWRMNPVTPLSFLDYMTRRLGFKEECLCCEFLRRCERIVLSIISDYRSVSYLPSVIANAAMLHVFNGVEPCLGTEYQSQLLGILRIDKDKVDECSELIKELASTDTQSNKRKFIGSIPPPPGSPNGVIDVSFSSDSSNDSWALSTPPSSVSSSPEPISKKRRALPSLNHANADFLSIPR